MSSARSSLAFARFVTGVTDSVASSERDRLFTGFNTPVFPEVLVVTTVGQEGIDGQRIRLDESETEEDEGDGSRRRTALTPIPEVMAEDLRLRLEAIRTP